MKLTELGTTGCSGGVCPTVYESDSGSIVVQGFVVKAAEAGVDLPAGEMLVEVPRSLLAEVFGA